MRRTVLGLAAACLLGVGCKGEGRTGTPAGDRDSVPGAGDSATAPVQAVEPVAPATSRALDTLSVDSLLAQCGRNQFESAADGSMYGIDATLEVWSGSAAAKLGDLSNRGRFIARLTNKGITDLDDYALKAGSGERSCWWVGPKNENERSRIVSVFIGNLGKKVSKLEIDEHRADHAGPKAEWIKVRKLDEGGTLPASAARQVFPDTGEVQILAQTYTTAWAACASNACCRPR
jgi:hypothetical protein